MKIFSCFPSKYLKASDLNDTKISAVMTYVEMEDIGDTDPKPVLYFQNSPKGMVLNKTNAKVIASAYGEETGGWKDKSIILFPVMVDYRGESVMAIRIKLPTAKERVISIQTSSTPEADTEQMMEIWADREAARLRRAMGLGAVADHDADGVVWEETRERPATMADGIETEDPKVQRAIVVDEINSLILIYIQPGEDRKRAELLRTHFNATWTEMVSTMPLERLRKGYDTLCFTLEGTYSRYHQESIARQIDHTDVNGTPAFLRRELPKNMAMAAE